MHRLSSTHRPSSVHSFAAVTVLAALVAACGSTTGLNDRRDASRTDAGPPPDATADATNPGDVVITPDGDLPPDIGPGFDVFPFPDVGPPPPDGFRPCMVNEDCGPGGYCAAASCSGLGICIMRPGACPDIWSPVCGCDGQTYSNACEAAARGARIARVGACGEPVDVIFPPPPDVIFPPPPDVIFPPPPDVIFPPPPDVILPPPPDGSVILCADNRSCPPSTFCSGRACVGLGFCSPRPLACADIFSPVCGCDNRTYDNACFASAAGVRIQFGGPCPTPVDSGMFDVAPPPDVITPPDVPPPPPDVITPPDVPAADTGLPPACVRNADCSPTQFCQFSFGVCGGAGICVIRDIPCAVFPVCGCDGRTYLQACDATRAGVSIRGIGACR